MVVEWKKLGIWHWQAIIDKDAPNPLGPEHDVCMRAEGPYGDSSRCVIYEAHEGWIPPGCEPHCAHGVSARDPCQECVQRSAQAFGGEDDCASCPPKSQGIVMVECEFTGRARPLKHGSEDECLPGVGIVRGRAGYEVAMSHDAGSIANPEAPASSVTDQQVGNAVAWLAATEPAYYRAWKDLDLTRSINPIVRKLLEAGK